MRITNLLRSQKEKLSFRRAPSSAPPGTLVHTGRQMVGEVTVHSVRYDGENFAANAGAGAIPDQRGQGTVKWLDVRGLHRVDLVQEIGQRYRIHPLALEDIVDVFQRPKFEEYEDGVLILVKAFHYDTQLLELKIEQVSVYLTADTVVTFQEDAEDLFGDIRIRLEKRAGRIRNKGADYLAYALIDSVVDRYFTVLDHLEDVLDQIEGTIMRNPEQQVKSRIHNIRLNLLTLRKNTGPLREVVRSFGDYDDALITADTQLFIRDLRDHAIQVADLVETYRDINNGLYDLYVSEISLRMNRIMQTLTVVSTIFIPLSFLVGVYGMNFEYIPELGHQYGYFVLWGVMLSVIGGMLLWFRRQGWL